MGVYYRKIRIGTAYSCIGRTTLPRNGDFILKDGFPGGDRPGEHEAVTRTETKNSGSCSADRSSWDIDRWNKLPLVFISML